MLFKYDRLEQLIKEFPGSKSYICRQIGRPAYYLRDVIKQKNKIPEETQKTLAEILGTTVEYLNGLTDNPTPVRAEEIKLTHAQQTLLDMGLSEEEWTAAAAYIAAKRKLEENNEQ